MSSSKNWFKRKRYGYGWAPASVKGWLVLLVYLLFIILLAVVMLKDATNNALTKDVLLFLGTTAIATIFLVVFISRKGPKAKWRWGKKTEDNPDEDI